MVKIHITGMLTYILIDTKYRIDGSYPSSCSSIDTFSEECFVGRSGGGDLYKIFLASGYKGIIINNEFNQITHPLIFCQTNRHLKWIIFFASSRIWCIHYMLIDCIDMDNGKTGQNEEACNYYYENLNECGDYDDEDFRAIQLCCACNCINIFFDISKFYQTLFM